MKVFTNCFTIILTTICITGNSANAANELFRSVSNGNWNSTSTWEMSTNNGSTWSAATNTPDDTSGIISVRYPNVVTVTSSVSADQLAIDSGTVSVNSGIVLTIKNGSGDDLIVLRGGTVTGSGTVQTQGTLIGFLLRAGSNFNAMLKVNSGVTVIYEPASPNISKIYGPVTIDSGATLSATQSGLSSYRLELYGNLTNNGTLTSAGSSGKTMSFKGSEMINNGTVTTPIFAFDSTSNLSGSGSFTVTNDLYIGATGNVTMLSDMTFSPSSEFIFLNGGILNPNGFIVNFILGTLVLNSGAVISNSGLFKTQNTVTLNLRAGSNFSAPLNVSSGTTAASEFSSPNIGRLYGPVTIDAGAILSGTQSGLTAYKLEFYGNLTNNGTITSAGSASKSMSFKGGSMVNNGTVTNSIFTFDSTSNLSGSGSFMVTNDLYIGVNGNITLLSNMTFSPANEFFVLTGGILNPNGFTVNYTSGNFVLNSGATVLNSGLFKTQNTVTLTLRNGSFFNVPLRVSSGLTAAYDPSSPNIARIFGTVTVDTGATLSGTQSGLTSYKLELYGNVTNNGTLTAVGSSGKTMIFKCPVFVNNGLVSTPIVSLDTNITLSGSGSFITNVNILSNRNVTLTSTHQMHSININAGGKFDISNRLLKLTASNPIAQNGTFTTTGSKIEYNGTALQSVSTTNILYNGLRINNPAGTTLLGNITIPDTLSVILGDLNLNAKIITLTSTAYMTETPGNTVFGVSGYITTTRNISSPSGLNVAGMGAVLTQSSNLGSTEIRRGHTVQTGLNGGTSIKRYYDITPANNTGLNATLVFKFDDSELNGKPEPSLKLFKSTNAGSTWLYMGGAVNITNNTITLPGITSFSRWSADSSGVSAALSLIMEGFYNIPTNNLNMSDTVRAYLRNSSNPFAIADSAIGILDSLTFRSAFQFSNASTGTYYIQLKHRNSLETWSKNPVNYTMDSTLNYDFTFAASQAYGNNEVLKGTRYCIYSGDVEQNGLIDLSDVIIVNNASSVFTTGYAVTDVNGNSIVDLTDVLITNNNATKFITKMTP
ncbi:MAG TPA: hypothetical protein PKA90_03090 [Ignavibacteria bacterium]|nr:hypothetical protein [Ignavibacteria bacterium]HMR39394.1 hypothetical protein [Ignavibacteria bacterium]